MVQSLILQSHVKHREPASMYPNTTDGGKTQQKTLQSQRATKQLGIMKHLLIMLLCKFGSIFKIC